MIDKDKIQDYIDLFQKTGLGILSVDIGYLANEKGEWTQELGLCNPDAKGIHEEISDLYKHFLSGLGKEPVNYLFDHFQKHPDLISENYYAYVFKVDPSSFMNSDQPIHSFEYKLEKDIRGVGNCELMGDGDKAFICNTFFSPLREDRFIYGNSFDKFKESQRAFTNAVGYAYFKKFGQLLLSYVTVVILTYRRGDCSLISHTVVLFSNGAPQIGQNHEITGNPILQLLFENIRGDRYLDRIDKLSKELQKESEKSARAAIMSRNMSHNLGSHVMSYLKQHLSSVTTILHDNVLHEMISGTKDNGLCINKEIGMPKLNNNIETIGLPFLLGVGHFISYLQERQDFIATIATDYIPYNSTINFKDSIYDELNPDKRSERHKERSSKLDNIILGNIARSEGLGRGISPTLQEGNKLGDIIIKFRQFNGDKDSSDEDLKRLRYFDVSLPGGVVGRQAVFSIVENVIRNAAKHGDWRKDDGLTVQFDCYANRPIKGIPSIDSAPSSDNLEGSLSLQEVLTRYYKDSLDGNDLFFVTLTDNTVNDINHLAKLRLALRDSFLNSSNKGLKEMRISASWLRSIKDDNEAFDPFEGISRYDFDDIIEADSGEPRTNNHKKKAPVIYARLSSEVGRRGRKGLPRLQYIFCLPIPKEVALISSHRFSSDTKSAFQDLNWSLYSIDDYKLEPNKSFDFILCEDPATYFSIRPLSSAKTFCLSDVGLTIEHFEWPFDAQFIRNKLYEHLSGFVGHEFDRILIDDSTVYEDAKIKYNNGIVEKVQIDGSVIKRSHVDPKDRCEVVSEICNQSIYSGLDSGAYFKDGNVFVSNAEKEPTYDRYVYRTHHETEENFIGFMQGLKDRKLDFVEGITGNNATDRIVRHEEKNDKWFHSHLHAMKHKVAIFDERIFYKIYGLDEASFTRGNVYIPDASKQYKCLEEKELTELSEAKQHYISLTGDQSIINRINSFSNLAALQSTMVTEFADILVKEEVETRDYHGLAYEQKGISLFTFVAIKKQSKGDTSSIDEIQFTIKGIKRQDNVPVYNSKSYKCVCSTFATLVWNKITKSLSIIPENRVSVSYNSITIHQGLLDKIYEAFDIKDDTEAKNHITTQLFSYFSNYSERDIIYGDDSVFYPGFFIHSGRSKPSGEVMSQHVPFIQYASLEHAALDCKYSLVELLDNARYE